MIYLQFDEEFDFELFRIVKLIKYHYIKKTREIQSDKYIICKQYNNNGKMKNKEYSLSIILGDGGIMPKNDKIISEKNLIKLIFNNKLMIRNDGIAVLFF